MAAGSTCPTRRSAGRSRPTPAAGVHMSALVLQMRSEPQVVVEPPRPAGLEPGQETRRWVTRSGTTPRSTSSPPWPGAGGQAARRPAARSPSARVSSLSVTVAPVSMRVPGEIGRATNDGRCFHIPSSGTFLSRGISTSPRKPRQCQSCPLHMLPRQLRVRRAPQRRCRRRRRRTPAFLPAAQAQGGRAFHPPPRPHLTHYDGGCISRCRSSEREKPTRLSRVRHERTGRTATHPGLVPRRGLAPFSTSPSSRGVAPATAAARGTDCRHARHADSVSQDSDNHATPSTHMSSPARSTRGSSARARPAAGMLTDVATFPPCTGRHAKVPRIAPAAGKRPRGLG